MTLFKWSRTASSNATADSTINWSEGQAPSSINDSARAEMAAVAKYRDDIAGAITTGGSSTAYTISSYQGFDSLANMDGKVIAFTPHATNGGTSTLNVDGLGAKPLRSAPSVELPAGTLILGTPYVATYNNTAGVWYLQGFFGNPYSLPIGGLLPFAGSTAPNSSFVLPYGQAISRTTYATLFSLIGTTYGVGDGTTTFNLPDAKGRSFSFLDNMGGAAANRITTIGGGTTLGASGGEEKHVITLTETPEHDHDVYVGETPHRHMEFNNDLVGPAVTNTTKPNTYSSTGNSYDIRGTASEPDRGLSGLASANVTVGSSSGTPTDNKTAKKGGNGGDGSAAGHNNMPPTLMVNCIMRII